MVKATCDNCGATHEFDDADVPPSGKVVTCLCGEPVTVMHASAAEMGFSAAKRHPTTAGMGDLRTPGPKATALGLGGARMPTPPGKPAGKSLLGGPSVSAFDADEEEIEELDDADVSFIGGGTDLAGVEAPERKSALAEATSATPMKKAPKSALAAALDKIKVKKSGGPKPAGITDLPAPVGPKPSGVTDLPAPVGPAPTKQGGKATALGVGRGVAPGGVTDLPAPVGPRPTRVPDLPVPVGPRPSRVPDLPAPVGPTSRKSTDLPAPVGPTSRKSTDLPAPVGPTPSKNIDLPTPVGPTPSRSTDLPTPVGPTPSRSTDLPTPVGPTPTKSTDLPTPVGPTPTKSTDLPAPKGFFDDVPQPKRATSGAGSAARGFFDDVPAQGADVGADKAAPRGFFDDLPSGESSPSTPKGFFDDVSAGAGMGAPGASETERLGSGANLPDPSANVPSLDLDDLDLSPPTSTGLDAGGAAAGGSAPPLDLGELPDLSGPEPPKLDLGETPLQLGDSDAHAPMSLDLGETSGKLGGERFGEVDLPSLEPSMPEQGAAVAGVVTFSKPSSTAEPAPEKAPRPRKTGFDEGSLELDDEASDHARARRTGTTAGADISAKLDTKAPPSREKRAAAAADEKEEKPRREMSRRQKLIALGAVGVVALGAGGFWLYSKKRAADERKRQVSDYVKASRSAIRSDQPKHWDNAARSAEAAIRLDGSNSDALGLAAQAHYAGYLDEGTRREERTKAGRALITKINAKSAQGPEIDKAEALRAIVEGQAARAINNLTTLTRDSPKDADAFLYLGWAHEASHQDAKAAASFQKTLALNPNRIAAHYGLGKAQLALGKTKEARTSFKKAWDLNQTYKDLDGWVDHFGARIGQYQAMKIERYNERETLYLGITKEKDANKGDPRAISLAFALAGIEALRAGRIDEARIRFDRALVLDPNDLAAVIGAAQAKLAQGRTDEAREKLASVLEADPHNLDAILALAEVAVREGNPDEAQERVDVILKRDPPLENKADLARAHLVQGAIFERDPAGLEHAIAEYEKAAALVTPEVSIRPTITLANALARHPEKAKQEQGLALLGPLHERAKDDAALSVSLGLAYMSGNKPAEAETWFRSALEMKPDDVETMFQLGLSLFAQERFDEAIDSIRRAFEADHEREDIGLRLGVIYEELDRDDDAKGIYETLINDKKIIGKEPSINVRARVGRFYARKQNFEEVRKHAEAILAENEDHPAGLFLKGEILAHEGKIDESIRYYQDAVNYSSEPQYFDGLGRALENLQPPALDDALKAYREAAKQEDYLSPRLGIARIRLLRNEYSKGIEALEDALRLAPEDAWIHAKMGHCYLMTSRPKDAVRYLDKAVKYDSHNEDAWHILGNTYFELNKPSNAANALARATSEFEKKRDADPEYDLPWVTDAYQRLFYAERARGNRGAAIRAAEKYLARDPENRIEAENIKKEMLFLRGGR